MVNDGKKWKTCLASNFVRFLSKCQPLIHEKPFLVSKQFFKKYLNKLFHIFADYIPQIYNIFVECNPQIRLFPYLGQWNIVFLKEAIVGCTHDGCGFPGTRLFVCFKTLNSF